MALWPFRRSSGRKRSRSGATMSDAEGPPPRSFTEGAVPRAKSKKKQRTDPAKLQRRARTYSFSPGRQDSIRVDRQTGYSEGPGPSRLGVNAPSTPDASEPLWDRTPTLHHKRTQNAPTREKKSKRKRRDHDREAEIKAMSHAMPRRPATDDGAAGRPMKKDSKRMRPTTMRRHWDDPVSEVSLPMLGSVHSSLSSDSDLGAYKLSAFDSLAPRPTLRYAPHQRWTTSRASVPARPNSHKAGSPEREPLHPATLKAHKRIHDLADDLDASDLRQLMERDKRRRDRKRQDDQDRVERGLARRAERHKSDEAEAKKSGTPPPENLERGVVGRELAGLGIGPASAVVTSSKRRTSGISSSIHHDEGTTLVKPLEAFHQIDRMPVEEPLAPTQRLSRPRESSHSTDLKESGSAVPQASLLTGLLRSRKSRSKSTLGSDQDKPATPPPGPIQEDSFRKDSEASNKATRRFSLSSFLRRSGKSRRDSGPSSFSNTSREEMRAAAITQAQALQAQSRVQAYAHADSQARTHAQNQDHEQSQGENEAQVETSAAARSSPIPQSNAQALAKLQGLDTSPVDQPMTGSYVSRRLSSGVPKRTRSRFREDLPDFPLSPPDSRVQSPEAEPPLPTLSEHNSSATELPPIVTARYDTPTSGHRSTDSMRYTPTSIDRAFEAPSPDTHQSISLASIDSEGSWLSGMRSSLRASAIRDSIVRVQRREQAHASASPSNSTQEDLSITDDDYLSRLAPAATSGTNHSHRPSGDGRPSSDEEDITEEGDMKWGAVGAHPKVIHSHRHDRETMQSREGILNMDSGDDTDSPVSRVAEEKADLQRARSVNLSKNHARNFSAGSAKLLDISPRLSLDSKNRSRERRSRSRSMMRNDI